MDKEELNKWILTDEGKEWLEGLKKPLADKRDELLGEIAGLKKRLADAASASNASAGKIQAYINRLKAEHCNRVFSDYEKYKSRLIEDPELREFVLGKIERMAGGGLVPDIDDGGNFTFADASGKSFEDYYSEWLATDGAKSYIANSCTGGGARGNSGNFGGVTLNAIERMTPLEVARNLDSPAFRQSLQSLN